MRDKNQSSMLNLFQIAEGLDRHRSDSSLLIWDIHAKYGPDHGLSHDRRSSVQQHDAAISKPFVEIGRCAYTFYIPWNGRFCYFFSTQYSGLALFI